MADGTAPEIAATVEVIAAAAPDVLVLAGIDFDHDLAALTALEARLSARGAGFPYMFAQRPNTGMATGIDLDGDGRLGGPGDSQGFGRYAGEDGLALLSRLPVLTEEARDFTGFLWRDLPGALLPEKDGAPFPSEEAQAVQRLSSTGHWAVPVLLPSGRRLTVMTWYATPPVFDGPEDRNGRRNHDEAAFWTALADGRIPGELPPDAPFVLMGAANLDPADGDGLPTALNALLAHPAFTDPRPQSAGAKEAAARQGGANLRHRGAPELDTADWRDDGGGPGNLRVDYVLPSAGLRVLSSGVMWPLAEDPMASVAQAASRHRLVWVDIQVAE